MRTAPILFVCGGLVLFAASGCRKQAEPDKNSSARVVAKVCGETITEADLEQAIQTLPKHQQAEYQSVLGRKRFLEKLVGQRLIVCAGLKEGLDKDPEIESRLRELREALVQQKYFDRMLEAMPKPTEEDLRRYYDAHPDEYRVPARINASYIKCATKAAAEAARRRIVDRGENFGEVAREVTIDKCSQGQNGLLGYFNPAGFINCIGNRPEFAAKAFELEADDVGPIFPWEGGWAFIKVHEKTTERIQPYSQARDAIEAHLRPQLTDSLVTAEEERLRSRLSVQTFLDTDAEFADKSADELMRLATETTTPIDKIEYYRVLLRKYPHHEHADEAQFMIAFVYSEELHDFDTARKEYQKVIDDYPNSEVRESAIYMQQNMGHGEPPQFQEQPSPDTSAPQSAETPGR
jgi:EpsD family peptidyl-prolyl cis-trans isomerase